MRPFIIHICAKEPALCRVSSLRNFSLWHFGNFLLGFGVGGVYGAAERGRHAAPAVFGRFTFISRLGLVFDTDSGFAGHDDDDGRNRATPRPPFQAGGESKKGLSSGYYRSLGHSDSSKPSKKSHMQRRRGHAVLIIAMEVKGLSSGLFRPTSARPGPKLGLCPCRGRIGAISLRGDLKQALVG